MEGINTKYAEVVRDFESFFNRHAEIKTFIDAQTANYQAKTDNLYAMAVLCPITTTLAENSLEISFNLFCIDRLNQDNSNLRSVLNTMLEVCKDFKGHLMAHDEWTVTENIICTELEESFDDNVAGWVMSFSVIVPQEYGDCFAPVYNE